MTDATASPAPKWLQAIRALRQRHMAAMLVMAFAAGIPYGAVLGTLNAWLTEAGIKPSTIGILSFITLAYAFKFLWAPVFQRPLFLWPTRFGPRRAWLLALQGLITLLLFWLSFSDPGSALPLMATLSLMIALASATHDIVLDAWRLEVARTPEDIDPMVALFQFGYRLAGLMTGLGALALSDDIGWQATYTLIAMGMALAMLGVWLAPEPEGSAQEGRARQGAETVQDARPTYGNRIMSGDQTLVVTLVLGAWAVAVVLIGQFMWQGLMTDTPPSGGEFIRTQGPLVVGLSVLVPAFCAGWLLFRRQVAPGTTLTAPAQWVRQCFQSILDPLMDLLDRLRWAALLVLALVLCYRFTDLVWGAFAFPFYLGNEHGAIGHTSDEIAFASKTFGVLMTVAGSALGAVALLVIGRMPCLVIGAFTAAVTNLLYADLALGGGGLDGFLGVTGLQGVFAAVGIDARMARLLTTIAAENVAGGFASVAYVAFLSAVVNPKFAAVQFALLASLTMLVGTLGRAPLGDMIEIDGYAAVFTLTFWLGLVAVAFSALEAWRQRRRVDKTVAS